MTTTPLVGNNGRRAGDGRAHRGNRVQQGHADRTGRATDRISGSAAVTEAEISGATRLTVPYGAIFYDSMGNAWVYTNPEGLSYHPRTP